MLKALSANNFSESDERLLKGLADLAVIALQNAQAYETRKTARRGKSGTERSQQGDYQPA